MSFDVSCSDWDVIFFDVFEVLEKNSGSLSTPTFRVFVGLKGSTLSLDGESSRAYLSCGRSWIVPSLFSRA